MQDDDKKARDGFSEIAFDLSMDELGVEVVRNEESGDVALFPQEHPDVDEWEAKCIAMHERLAAENDAWMVAEGLKKEDAEHMDSAAGPRNQKAVLDPSERGEIHSKVRGARLKPVNEHGNSGPDELPEHHRSGHGTVGLNVIKV